MSLFRERIAVAMASGARDAALLAVLCVLLLTAWVCLVLGLVALLRPALGLGWALLALCAALLVTGLAILAILRARRDRRPPPLPAAQAALPLAALVLPRVGGRTGLRLGLGVLAAGLVAVAVMLPPSRRDGGSGRSL
ncbi:hypothetical protein PVT71_26295 (plasmid) [Salipiger sp. H15]|uniref:Uncharacterized protein n=1 Tax=Alloyangia sp. H15 TaxID=3029062 RepID=A0AAU8ASR3_9RHOB